MNGWLEIHELRKENDSLWSVIDCLNEEIKKLHEATSAPRPVNDCLICCHDQPLAHIGDTVLIHTFTRRYTTVLDKMQTEENQ